MNYEDNIKKLDEIIKLLNDDKIEFSKKIDLYKEALNIADENIKILNEYKSKIEVLNEHFTDIENKLSGTDTSDND